MEFNEALGNTHGYSENREIGEKYIIAMTTTQATDTLECFQGKSECVFLFAC